MRTTANLKKCVFMVLALVMGGEWYKPDTGIFTGHLYTQPEDVG